MELHKWGGVKYEEPLEALQLWAKPQPGGAVAILVINVAANIGLDFEVSLAELGLPSTSTVSVRDIWQHQDLGHGPIDDLDRRFSGTVQGHVNARDSAFLLLRPLASPMPLALALFRGMVDSASF